LLAALEPVKKTGRRGSTTPENPEVIKKPGAKAGFFK
jgi:hypothetical protein